VGPQPAQALLTVPNVRAHPSTASVPTTILLYNCQLLCSFVPTEGLVRMLLVLREYIQCQV